jgi:predicted secreted protein
MTKFAAWETQFTMGTCQVETATCVGAGTAPGNLHVVCTSALIAGSPLTTIVAYGGSDTVVQWAEKVRVALLAVPAIVLNFKVGGSGIYVTLTARVAAADEVALNIDIHKDSGTGPVDDLTSDTTTAGVAYAARSYCTNIGGPGLALDTVDVTTHDSTGAWEEVVGTILREGEVTLDLVFDPAEDTMDFTAAGSMGLAMKNKVLHDFGLIFSNHATHTTWTFPGYVTGYTPAAPHDGALTASVTVRISGAPILA